jgi:pyrimidine-nucleoside phosphorylase
MISGRGLAHSGGTLDKLESIPGMRTNLSLKEYQDQVASIGIAMIGQTDEIAPADREIYALRDVTGTVEYAPFITASIMSKKLAEGIDALVLDVKFGRGAFMPDIEKARQLAHMMTDVATHFEKPIVALLTRMDAPLGNSIGNWPEVAEAVRCLRGEDVPDITELTVALASEMLLLGGVVESISEAETKARTALKDGSGYEKLAELILAQGGDPWVLDTDRPHSAAEVEVRYSDGPSGYVSAIDSRAVGYLGVDIGAGRRTLGARVDPGAGIVLEKRVNDEIRPGDLVGRISTNRTDRASEFEQSLLDAITVSEEPTEMADLILDRIESGR